MKSYAFLLGCAALALASPVMADATAAQQPNGRTIADIVRSPADLPPPLPRGGPKTVKVNLKTVEVTGQLDDGATYRYWTFNGQVPGPFVRVRVGDTVDVTLTNSADSTMMHNVDFHAVTGPGGGAMATTADPGQTKGFTFKALHPGLFVYHCAIPLVAEHISNGMYGLILVEPEHGLSKVDHEYYVMQGEIYTDQARGAKGELTQSIDKLWAEQPEFMVFNGAVDGLTRKPLTAKVGETVRIFFGDAGPNKISSFHMIGEIFDKAWPLGSLTSPPITDVQTIEVPPGGAAIVDIKTHVPGEYFLVDHAISRVDKGLKGVLEVSGEQRADIFQPHEQSTRTAASR